MNKKLININLILILVCVLLCVSIICISIIIPKYQIQKENNENIVKEEVRYAHVFYATIREIKIYEDNTTLVLIKGLEVNDINDRGMFYFSIKENTELLWRGTEIKLSDLKEGQTVSIFSIGDVLESSPATLTKVVKVLVLDDEL